MDMVSIRIITDDVKRLVQFYERALNLTAKWLTEEFAELATPSCTLAFGSQKTMDLFGAGAAHAADNRTVILEFRVADVDGEFTRLTEVVAEFVQKPVTQRWGNRSFLFRDPDGNLINFFTPVTPAAKKKLEKPRAHST